MQQHAGEGGDRTTGEGPLAGCNVVELGSTVAGPFCTRLLADFGADVIKVEQPEGDAVRFMGKRKHGRSLYAASIFRGKRIAAIDLRTDPGRDIVRRLCEQADVVVENFRPGTLERWGLGYKTLSEVNPRLVLARISGYGQDGPYNQRPGYGVVCEAVSGLREVTGDPDRPPARVAVSLTDYITGLYTAFGISMALRERDRTGRGQVIDSALYEAAFSFMEPHIPAYQQLGHVARRAGPRLPDHTPNSLYVTRDERYIHIAAGSQPVFKRLVAAMGREDLAQDPRFATAIARSEHEDAVDAEIEGWTGAHNLEDIERALQNAGVPAARIYTMEDVFADPHYRARGAIAEVADPELGPVAMASPVPRLSASPGGIRWAGRDIGADTEAILTGELGLSRDTVARLLEEGVAFAPREPSCAGPSHDYGEDNTANRS